MRPLITIASVLLALAAPAAASTTPFELLADGSIVVSVTIGGTSGYRFVIDTGSSRTVIAERVWRVVFGAGAEGAAVNRENGERLKEKLLKWGGGRDPWICLADTLEDGRLAPGDEKSMALVGSWGIKR